MNDFSGCARCGSPLVEGARFCRECGAAVDPTQADEVAAAADPAEETCPSCGASAGSRAVFCRACGERIGPETPLPPPVPPAPPQGPQSLPPPRPHQSGRAGRGQRVVGAVLLCLLLGAAVAGGAYLFTKDGDGGSERTPSPFREPFPDLGTGPEGGSGSDRKQAKPEDNRPEPEDVSVTDSGDGGGFSSLTPGRYVQAGSFRTPGGAGNEVERLVGEGIDVEAVPADEAAELLPGFQVLLVGPLSGDGEEEGVLEQLEEAGVSGIARDLTPSRELASPAAATGEWDGSFEETHLRGNRSPKTYEVVLSIDSDGEGGTVAYPDQECGGTLKLLEDAGYSLAYREWIDYGDCIDEGIWHLRPDGSQLTGVWLHDDYELLVNGTASAS